MKGILNRNHTTAGTDDEIIDAGGFSPWSAPDRRRQDRTTAKLAAQGVVRHGADSVALLTTDGYRIGAHVAIAHLRPHPRRVQVARGARTPPTLRRTLADLSGKRMKPIDTIGMSQRDRLVAEQAAMLDRAGDVRRLLLLNATSRGDTDALDDVVRAYGRKRAAATWPARS